MQTDLSIIIPTLNEENYLPGLLDAISRQTWPPLEIIVADAGSSDQTVEVAQKAGCRVVPGGRPARGRNAGVAVARGDIFLFLDADVKPEAWFLAHALAEFNRRGLDVATCPVKPLEGNLIDAVFHETANVFMQAIRPVSPHAPGFCIFARRQAHQNIGGFDETLLMSEDHDYVRRITAQRGRFGILHFPITVSVRRLQTDGRWNVALRYAFLSANQMLGNRFNQALLDRYLGEYRFGDHQPNDFHRQAQYYSSVQHIGQITLSSVRRSANDAKLYTYAFVGRIQPWLVENHNNKPPNGKPARINVISNVDEDHNAG